MLHDRVGRRAVLASAGAAFAVGPAACGTGGGSGSDSERTSYRIWLPGPQSADGVSADKAFYEKTLGPYADEHRITLNFTIVPWSSYEQKYLTGISSGDGPDVGYMYTEMMGTYIDHGSLAPLDDYVDEDMRSRMLYLDEGTFDGTQYGIPYVVGNPRVVYANMDLLEQVGVTELPRTWDEFLETAARVGQDTDAYGVIMSWGQSQRGVLNEAYFPFLWQAGGDIFTEDGSRTAFNDDRGIRAATFLRLLIDEGAMPSAVSGLNDTEAEQVFTDGRCAFYPSATSKLGEYSDSLPNLSFIDSLKDEKKATFIANDALIMTSTCPDKEIGAGIIKTMTEGKTMSAFHKEVVTYPPIGQDEKADPNDPFASMYTEREMLRGLPINGGGIPTYNALFESLQQVIVGQKSPEAALADASAQGDAALKAGN